MQLSIHQLVDKTDDLEILALVLNLLKKLSEIDDDTAYVFEGDGTAISEEEFINSVLQSSKEVKSEGVISHKEMKARFGIHE